MTAGDTATKQQGVWDFSQALALINNLRSPSPTPQDPLQEYQIPPADPSTGTLGLGDFNRLWNYLQTESPSRKDKEQTGAEPTFAGKDEPLDFQNLAYTSDGGIFASSFKRKPRAQVRWNDEITDINDTIGDTGGDTAASVTGDEASAPESPLKSRDSNTDVLNSDLNPAGKKESKKVRKKKRKQEEKARAQEAAARQKAKSDVESEAELGTIARVTPARKASVHSNKMLTPTKDDQSNIKKTRKPRLPYTVSMPETQQDPFNASEERRMSSTAEEQQKPAPSIPASERRTKIIMPLSLPKVPAVKDNNVPSGPKLAPPTPSKSKRRPSNTADTPAAPKQNSQPTTRPPTGPRKNSQPPSTPAVKPAITSTPNAAAASLIPTSTPAKKPVLAAYLQNQAPMRPASAVSRPPQPATIASPVPDHTIPIIARSKVDRDIDLRLRMIQDFIEDKRTLASPIHMANHNQDEKGLHVFVDFSNIWIGFMDILWQIKQKYIHRKDIYIDRKNKNLSFESLVLLLERGRPVAKRVLAGSPPLMPAHEMAKRIGYKTLILDKVYKQKILTERQIFFETRDAERKAERGAKRRSESHGASAAGAQQPYTPTPSRTQPVNGSTGPLNGTGTSTQEATDPLTAAANAVAAATAQLRQQGAPSFATTPSTKTPRQQNPTTPHAPSNNLIQSPSYNPNNTLPTPTYNPNLPARRPSTSHPQEPEHLAPAKWVEQAVDEMLHLHMLESMVDFSPTPGTMVLATGDAALAEYSGGFKEQVERALKKGWKVELVAFSKSIAGAYRKRGFFEEWEGRFRIIELDDYAEFLLDEGGEGQGMVG